MYSELNYKIEERSKLFHLALVKMGVSVFLLPPVITTYVNLFVNDLGENSYEEFQMM